MRDNQAGTAALVLVGGLLILVALMRRIPLRFEVAGTKVDATYEIDMAFDAGRDAGVREGLEVAVEEVRSSVERGDAKTELLDELWREIEMRLGRWSRGSQPFDMLTAQQNEGGVPASNEGDDRNAKRTSQAAHAISYDAMATAAVVGITQRQLDYWAHTGLVEPSVTLGASVQHARYSFRDVLLLKVIKRLLDAGVSLPQIRTVIVHLKERPTNALRETTLVSDGQSVYEATSPDEVIELLQNGRATFGIALGRLLREVEQELN
ncbi:hypothetical protein GCM10023317_05990 [Actinopolymorpha pittospori]